MFDNLLIKVKSDVQDSIFDEQFLITKYLEKSSTYMSKTNFDDAHKIYTDHINQINQ